MPEKGQESGLKWTLTFGNVKNEQYSLLISLKSPNSKYLKPYLKILNGRSIGLISNYFTFMNI